MKQPINGETPGSKTIKKIFSKSTLPPLFGANFGKGNLTWKRLENIDFEKVGRILVCHLVIESYLNKLIELRAPSGLDVNGANLNFSQKLRMVQNDHVFKEHDFHQGITIINKIRNKFSHNIEAEINKNEVGILKSILEKFDDKKAGKKKRIQGDRIYTDLAIIEDFTSLTCAYMAGYCSALVGF